MLHPSSYDCTPDTLLVDLDNTVVTSAEYMAFTFRAMMHAICDYVECPEKAMIQAMARHYSERGIESPSLLQSLETTTEYFRFPPKRMEKLKRSVRKAFNAAKSNHLRPYEGMPELLKAAKDDGREVIALTDSQILHTSSKLQAHKSHLLGKRQFTRLIGIQDSPEPSMPRHEEFARILRSSLRVPYTSTTAEKPNTDLETLLEMTREQIRQRVAIVGDNYQRDMELANRYGMRGYHAMYGVIDSATYLQTIQQFTGKKGPQPTTYLPPRYPSNIIPIGHPDALYDELGLEKEN